jgi:hypothetical protein
VKENRLRGFLLALAGSLALAASAGVAAGQSDPPEAERDPPEATSEPAVGTATARLLRAQIRALRANAWHWQRVMGKRRAPTAFRERLTASVPQLTRMRNAWRASAKRARKSARRVPNRSAWLCIHRYEGSWKDPHPPYYGGLQMDISFQRAYGRYLLRTKGTADRWRPLEQMWTAEKARRSGRGFYPWPNTARRCGLI